MFMKSKSDGFNDTVLDGNVLLVPQIPSPTNSTWSAALPIILLTLLSVSSIDSLVICFNLDLDSRGLCDCIFLFALDKNASAISIKSPNTSVLLSFFFYYFYFVNL
jgi:hypothetical protein